MKLILSIMQLSWGHGGSRHTGEQLLAVGVGRHNQSVHFTGNGEHHIN